MSTRGKHTIHGSVMTYLGLVPALHSISSPKLCPSDAEIGTLQHHTTPSILWGMRVHHPTLNCTPSMSLQWSSMHP